MTSFETGRTRSDERLQVRLGLRDDIDRIVASASSSALTPEDILRVIVESAVAHYALVGTPEEVAYEIGRLSRRIRAGDRLEL